MGIADYISRIKQKHREKIRTTTKSREGQIKQLKVERKELEKKRKADSDYKEEKSRILRARTEPIRRGIGGLRNFTKNIKKQTDSVDARKANNPFSGGGFGGGSPFSGGGSGGGSPFAGGFGEKEKKKEVKDSITIHIRR